MDRYGMGMGMGSSMGGFSMGGYGGGGYGMRGYGGGHGMSGYGLTRAPAVGTDWVTIGVTLSNPICGK
jgi:hypothetical protein